MPFRAPKDESEKQFSFLESLPALTGEKRVEYPGEQDAGGIERDAIQ